MTSLEKASQFQDALIFVKIGMAKILKLFLTPQKLRILTEPFFNAVYNGI